jgi:hypothetical protein
LMVTKSPGWLTSSGQDKNVGSHAR